MKKRSLKINLAIAALAAVIGSLFLISPANVSAESYSAPPQQVTFGHTYTGTINTTEDMYRYNVTLKKPGTVKINITLSNPDSEIRSLILKVYNSSGKLLYKKLVDKSHSVIAANLKKGRYYIVADGMMGTYKTTTFKLKPSYKGFPASSVKKLSNKAKKKLKVTWTKKSAVSGYQVQIATNSKFSKNKKSYTAKKNTITSKTFSKLKKSKKYYVRVRTYTITLDKTKVYSKWSGVKKKKIIK
ncbi:fibronectin type III domain-containing protein [Anaerostipes sp.]|uniref:fibronectin type III domain-containing protein n=1 Tax=Anaerostipes sp. TaxID=1872530 RepID=UPI0025C62330|nr:fibronectin type III domain-containing protein [Anaerostipes sp.]MBS7008879.1 fibronectin type III domain-containing protein [Anaerostipes sp.]